MIVAALLAAVVGLGRVPRGTAEGPSCESTTVDLARLLAIAVSAGLPLGAAIERVAPMLSGELAVTMDDVVRRSRRDGITAALLESDLGPLGPPLARAHSTGAPVGRTLEAFLSAANSRRVSEALERARTAPVKLMAPLVLFLLPGFTALVVGPGLADQFLDLTFFTP